MKLDEKEFFLIKDRIVRDFGIAFRDEKRELLEEFIEERLKSTGMSAEEYLSVLKDGINRELILAVSSITNKETFFFREMPQLKIAIQLLQGMLKSRHRLRILSLGCSGGEEPYTLSILLHERGILFPGKEVSITGIDIDPKAIKKAKEAVYSENSFRNKEIPLSRYFVKEDRFYRLKEIYKRIVDFREGNILDRKTFLEFINVDMVFCRNVFIYMTDEAIKIALENIYASLSRDGYLFTGSAESITNRTDLFIPEYHEGFAVYRKTDYRRKEAL